MFLFQLINILLISVTLYMYLANIFLLWPGLQSVCCGLWLNSTSYRKTVSRSK